YDFSNPQSFNRYSYVLNNPFAFTDPSGLDPCSEYGGEGGSCSSGGDNGLIGFLAQVAHDIAGLFAGGPSFHGSLKPRPNAQPWDEYHIHYGPDIAGAFGLPDPGCEFGACGAGPSAATQTQDGHAPAIRVLPYPTYQDILTMRAAFDAGIASLNNKGRLALSGKAGGDVNNIWQCARAVVGKPMYGCGGQAAYMYGVMDNLHLNGNWTFNYVYQAFPPHQFITATMPGGPSVLIDAWKNQFEVTY
ncbi:MAG: hypothetical protein ACREHG_08155, partial [Candidatus Saccharimonadales bacterium]